MIDRLRQTMSGAGYDLGAAELLDVLWLARVMEGKGRAGERATDAADDGPGAADASGAAGSSGAEGSSGNDWPDGTGNGGNGADNGHDGGDDLYAEPESGAGTRTGTDTDPVGPPRRALYAMGSQGGGAGGERARPARAPGRRALPDAQQLGRALRPLRRSRDHPHRTVTDIEATVRLAAETGFLDVVCRPDQERRWSAVLLVDCSPSMQVWGSLAAELRQLLSRSTVFRSVQVHTIDPRVPSGPVRRHQAAGTAVTFLLTDGTSHGWRGPQAVRALSEWGRGGPMAVLNPLPRRLWRGTALDARPRLLAAPGAFDPVGRLVVCDALSGEPDPDAAGALALPVLHPTASAVGQWAGLLTRPGVPHLVETALLGEAPLRTPPQPHGTAEELVTHFRGAFSPEAYRLAVRLSAIRPLTTPLMQLVRTATMRDTGPTNVAEILLGGLLERADQGGQAAAARTLDRALGAPPGQLVQPVYDFRPGVRELLFSGLGAEQAVEVVESVGRSLEPYMGRLPDFPVLMGDAAGELRLHDSARAFAVLASPVLERMGGAAREFAPSPVSGPAPQPAGSAPAPSAAVEPSSTPPQALRFTVLGPVRAWRGDTPLVSGSLRQRALLAALLLRRGRPATARELIDDLWGDEPPQGARNSLYAYTARLRRELRDDAVALIRVRDGYALRAPDGSPPALDLVEAERLIEQARGAGDPGVARQLRDRALALWDGEPLAGLQGSFVRAQRERLERWRRDLIAGVYRPFGQEEAKAAVPPTAAAPLPAIPEPFVGRTEEIARLVAALTWGDDDLAPRWVIHGPAGVGKTALAIRVAHEVADHFPDGQLYADLRGSERGDAEDSSAVADILAGLLRQLGVPADRVPREYAARAAKYRELLAERRVLIVLDDVPDAPQTLGPLLPAAPGTAVLITSRPRPSPQVITRTMLLPRLPSDEALELFTRLVGEERVAAEPEAAYDVAATGAGLPAAIRTLAAQVAASERPLAEWHVDRPDAIPPAHGDTSGFAVEWADIQRSLARELAAKELPDTQHDEALSRLLTCYLAMGRQMHETRYPGDRMVHDLARASNDGLSAAKDSPMGLAAWSDETLHVLALVRQAMVMNSGSVRHAADLLLLVQVTAESGAHAAAFEPAAHVVARRASIEGDARAEGRARVALADAYIAMGKFAEAEPEASEAGRLARAANDPLTNFRAPFASGIIALHQRRHEEAERHLTAAWEHCRTRNDELAEAAVLAALARLWAATGTGDEAVLFAERSVGIHRRAGDGGPRLAHGLYALAEALSAAGRHADALRELLQALPLFEEDRQRLWAGRTRCRMAEAMVSLIRPSEAAAAAQDAAMRLLVPGGERWRADALLALGHAETALGRKQSAQGHWREALAVYEAFGAPEARSTRALLRDKTAPPSSTARTASRTADTASTGTALRDLTAAVRTLRDQLRLQAAAQGTVRQESASPDLDAHLGILEAAEAELDGRVGDFERTGRLARPPRAGLDRLRDVVETVTASDAMPSATTAAAREVGRCLDP
ncbi:SAV_2336 N-terminal domain-related protein [Streptomyces sp. NPDC050636]|uniref:SAV_2336 N-terminal domain-related protein n=1 Tax=Streptomyces sp. NPDC050636 TaxID=3154510 RepID=UPI0034213F20